MAPEKTDDILKKLDEVLDTDWAQDLIEHYEHDHPEKRKESEAA